MWFLIFGAWAESLTLEQAWARAVQANLEIRSQRRANDALRLRLMSARGGFDPRLSLSVGTSGSQTPTNNVVDGASVINSSDRTWSAGLDQSLPTGGRFGVSYSEFVSQSDSANAASGTFARTSMGLSFSQPLLRGLFAGTLRSVNDAVLDVAAGDLRWRIALEQLVLDVADAYWGLLSARERTAIAERGVELALDQLAQTQERLDEGFAGTGDVLQVQVTLGQARRSLVEAEAAEGAASLQLSRMLGRTLSAEAIEILDRPQVSDAQPTTEALFGEAKAGNARWLLAGIEREQARRNARRARADALPQLDLDADAGFAAGGDDPKAVRDTLFSQPAPSWGMNLRLGLPVFMRESRAQLGLANVQQDQAELAYEAAEQDLYLRVDAAVRNLVRDRASLQVAEQTLEAAKQSLQAQRELFSEGRGATRDVVDSLESLRAAEATELDARIACQRSQLAAQRVAGTLPLPGLEP